LRICNIEIFTRFSSLCHTDSRKVKEKVAGKREFKKKEKRLGAVKILIDEVNYLSPPPCREG